MNGTEQARLPITADMFPCPACGAAAVGTIDTLVCRWSTAADGEVTAWQGNDLDTQERFGPGWPPGPGLRERP